MTDKANDKKEAAYQPPHAQQQPVQKAPKLRTTIGEKKIVANRAARQGDDGYQLNTVYDQVTVIFEDGSEKVINSADMYEPQ